MLDNTSLSHASAKSQATGGFRLGRLTLEVRQHMPVWQHAAISAGSILIGLAISAAILVTAGVEPSNLFQEVVLDIDDQKVVGDGHVNAPAHFAADLYGARGQGR